jgi:hypothetical protein
MSLHYVEYQEDKPASSSAVQKCEITRIFHNLFLASRLISTTLDPIKTARGEVGAVQCSAVQCSAVKCSAVR